MQRFVNSRAHLSPATRRKELRYVHGLLAWAQKRGYVRQNVAKAAPAPRSVRRLKLVPTTRQWLRLLCAIPRVEPTFRAERTGYRETLDDAQAWHVLILLAATTGIRLFALLSITRENVLPGPGGVLFVRCTSKGRESVHGLPPPIAERVLRRFESLPPADCPAEQRLFPWRKFPQHVWNKLRRRAHFPFTFHGLRAAAGMRAALDAALSASSGALQHLSPGVFQAHYADARQLRGAAAMAVKLPRLPPMPKAPKTREDSGDLRSFPPG